MAKSPPLPKGKGESLGLWGAEFSEDKANLPPRGSNHSLGSTVPSPTWEPMIIPKDSGDPLNGSSQTEKKPWEPRGIFIKPTDLYFSSAFQMSCVLLNAHRIHWRGGNWLQCTECPRNAFPGCFTSSAPAVSPALGCPCSQMQCIHSWVCSHQSLRKPCLGGGPLGWGRGWNRRCPCPVTRCQGPASFPGEDTCWDMAWHSRRPFLLLFFLQPLLPEPPGKRKRGKER